MTETGSREKAKINEELMNFTEFPIPTYDEWREVAEKSLRGKSFDTLLTKLLDDITLQPMYQQRDREKANLQANDPGIFPFTRGTSSERKSWEVSQQLAGKTPRILNEIAKEDLSRGQTVYHIVLHEQMKRAQEPPLPTKDSPSVGVPFFDLGDVEQAFAEIDINTPIHIDAGEVSAPLLAAIQEVWGKDTNKLRGVLGADPLHQLTRTGELTYPLEKAYDYLAKAVTWAKENAPSLRTVLVQTDAYQEGGASPAVELASALSTGVAYTKALLDRGVSINDIGTTITFSFAIGSDVFSEIAKIRAARTLWAAIMSEFGADEEAQKMVIHARTSSFTKSIQDTYVNILRGTGEAFAAAVAGVDSLHVSPFDETVQQPSSFSRRIARNTSLILQQEAYIDQTIDPAGGSWYVEHLTEELAKRAWASFQEIEKQDGIVAALQAGTIQQWVDKAWDKRRQDVETRKQAIVGVNKYVHLESENPSKTDEQEEELQKYAEEVKEKQSRDWSGLQKPQSLVEIGELLQRGVPFAKVHTLLLEGETATVQITSIPQRRLGEPFEQLRKRSEELFATDGKHPEVAILGIGKLAHYKARADFITGFFESGGFSVTTAEANDGEEAIKQVTQKPIIVLCGRDDAYEEEALALIENIKGKANDGKVFIAGQASDETEQSFANAGLDGYVHMKTNTYQLLHELQQWLKGGNE